MRSPFGWLGPAAFAGLVTALLAVDLVVWLRLRWVRRGREPPGGARPTEGRTALTSRTTFLPAGAGLAALAWGGWGPGGPLLRSVLAAGGLVIAVSGFAWRVVGIEITPDALTIRYAARRPSTLPLAEVTALRVPRWPLGGWRVTGGRRTCTLMASDLLGVEWVLTGVVIRAGLRFVAGAWQRLDRPVRVSPTA